jgi:primosomal replication protein N
MAALPGVAVNRVELIAQAVECTPLRFTPAGMPVLELTLAHESDVVEAGRSRRIEMTIAAIAMGDLARMLERISLGKRMKVTGFLAATRKGSSRLRLHIQTFVAVSEADTPSV